jgi:hypothetical protein
VLLSLALCLFTGPYYVVSAESNPVTLGNNDQMPQVRSPCDCDSANEIFAGACVADLCGVDAAAGVARQHRQLFYSAHAGLCNFEALRATLRVVSDLSMLCF